MNARGGARRRALLLAGASLAALPMTAARSAPAAAPADGPDSGRAPAAGLATGAPPTPPLRERRIHFHTSDGVALSAIECRPPALEHGAPAVLLVPGWCMPANVWRAQLRALGARWRAVALDPRGQGESEAPRAGYEADRRADDLSEVRRHIGPSVIVAWSMGALEALQCVHRHGTAGVRGLVLVDSSVGEPPVPAPVTGFVESLRTDRTKAVHDFVRAVFGAARTEEELQQIEVAALRMPLDGSIRLLSDSHPREHWRRIARGLNRPLAYLVTPQFREQAASLKAARPATTIEVFENAGHALFLDEPDRFNALLIDFIARLG